MKITIEIKVLPVGDGVLYDGAYNEIGWYTIEYDAESPAKSQLRAFEGGLSPMNTAEIPPQIQEIAKALDIDHTGFATYREFIEHVRQRAKEALTPENIKAAHDKLKNDPE